MNDKRLIFNFVPIVSGGGLQNALSLISDIPADLNCLFLVREGGALHKYCVDESLNCIVVGANKIKRLIFELKIRTLFKRGDICFTLFGPPPLTAINYLYNINGFAYSNILHKEIDFWWWCKPVEKIKKKLTDLYRAKITGSADEIIFETDLLLEKARNDVRFNSKKLHVVHMAPSKLVSRFRGSTDRNPKVKKTNFNILYLAGDHPNKRVSDLSRIAFILAKENIEVCFNITLPEGSLLTDIMSEATELGVKHYINNLGPIPQSEVGNTINSVDVMMNIAYLESFSNNVVEAWALSKPLIITDAEWARRSCHDAAVYVDVDNNASVVNAFKRVMNKANQSMLTTKGEEMLNRMPSAEQKHSYYFEIIRSAM